VYISLISKSTIFHSIIDIKLSREWFIHQTVLEMKPWNSDSAMDHASGTNSVVMEPKLRKRFHYILITFSQKLNNKQANWAQVWKWQHYTKEKPTLY
jgi:hypothetical protein